MLPVLGGLEAGSPELSGGVLDVVDVPALPLLGGSAVAGGVVVVVPDGGPLLPPLVVRVGLLVGGTSAPAGVEVVPVLVPPVLGRGVLSVVPVLGFVLPVLGAVTVGGGTCVPDPTCGVAGGVCATGMTTTGVRAGAPGCWAAGNPARCSALHRRADRERPACARPGARGCRLRARVGCAMRAWNDRLLDLDGPGGGDDGCGQQCCDMAGADRAQRCGGTTGPDRASGGDGAATCGRAASRATADAPETERFGDDGHRSERRDQRCELAAHAAQLGAEAAAALAVAHVAPCEAIGPYAAVVRADQLLADPGALGIARLERLRQAYTRAYEERFQRRHRNVKRLREIGVRHPAELAHQQGGALLLWKPLHVDEQAAQSLAVLSLDRGVIDGRAHLLEHLGRRGGGAAQLVDAPVVRDPVKPGPQRYFASIGAQAGVRADKDILDRVFGVLARAPKHLSRVREQPRPIAIVDCTKRFVVAGSEQRDKLLV